jgi:ferric-dicitrate binding protein FerR (iron transport regulator)
VSLTGEAVFTVARGNAVPFIVHTRNVTAQVLGTTFAVRGYSEEPTVRVAVTEGRVAVNAMVADQGSVATVRDDGFAAVAHSDSLASRLVSWTTGVLSFQKTPLREVAAELSRWYGVDFVLGDTALAQRHLTAVFQRDSLEDVLYLLAHTLQVRIKRSGRTILIMPGNPGEARTAVPPAEVAVASRHADPVDRP